MAEAKTLFEQYVDELAKAYPDVPRDVLARGAARQIIEARRSHGLPAIKPSDTGDFLEIARQEMEPDQLRAPTGVLTRAGLAAERGVQSALETIGLSRGRSQAIAGGVGQAIREPAPLAGAASSVAASLAFPGAGPGAALLRVAIPALAAGGTSLLTGTGNPLEEATMAGLFGAGGEALRGGVAVARGVRAARPAGLERRAAQLAGRTGRVTPTSASTEGLVETFLGGQGRAAARQALDLADDGVRASLGGGQTVITSQQIPELAQLAEVPGITGVRRVSRATRRGRPDPLFQTTVDDLLGIIKELKSAGFKTMQGAAGRNAALGFDVRNLARTIEGRVEALIPDPQVRAAWKAAQNRFAQTETLVRFFEAAQPIVQTGQGARLEFVKLQETLTKADPSALGRQPITFAEELRNVGLGDFVDTLLGGAPLGTTDRVLDPLRLFFGPSGLRGGSTLRVGIPVAPPFRVPAGTRPLPTFPFAVPTQVVGQAERLRRR